MKARATALAALLTMAATGCGGGRGTPVMPTVTGSRLDVAKADLKDAGVEGKRVTVIGGGAFGVVNERNWEVCDQAPDAGQPAPGPVRMTVDRPGACDEGDRLP